MFMLGIYDTAPARHDFARRAGQFVVKYDFILAVMDGISRERAARFRPENVVAEGEHWILWWEPSGEDAATAAPPLPHEELVAWLDAAAADGIQ